MIRCEKKVEMMLVLKIMDQSLFTENDELFFEVSTHTTIFLTQLFYYPVRPDILHENRNENRKESAKFNYQPNFPKILTSHFPDLKIFPKFWLSD